VNEYHPRSTDRRGKKVYDYSAAASQQAEKKDTSRPKSEGVFSKLMAVSRETEKMDASRANSQGGSAN
jgi:hypothetical protein